MNKVRINNSSARKVSTAIYTICSYFNTNTILILASRSILLSFLFILLLPNLCFSKEHPPTRYNSYDGVAPGGRSLAMGLAFCAISEDASAIYFNPAGLTTVPKQIVSITYEITRQSDLTYEEIFNAESIQDKKFIFLGFVSSKGAISYRPLSNTLIRTDAGNDWEETEIKINAYTLSASHKKDEKISYGLNLTYLSGLISESGVINNLPFANIDDGHGFSADFGIIYNIAQEFTIGTKLENVFGIMWWNDYEKEILPFGIRIGFSFQIADFLTFSSDWNKNYYRKEVDPIETSYFGIEQTIYKQLKFRAGTYGSDFRTNENCYITTGLGYQKNFYSLSLATEKYKKNNKEVFRYLLSLDLPL